MSKVVFPQQIFYRFSLGLTLTIVFLVSSCIVCSPAIALLRQHHEAPNVLRYHAQDSLKDRDGNTWQVVLFPDHSQSTSISYFLRLVGFPGVNSFNHPQSLEILTSQGRIFSATDAYEKSAPAPNVGQFDLTPIINRLPSKGTLKLSTSLKDNRELALRIPYEVLTEWQLLIQEIEPK